MDRDTSVEAPTSGTEAVGADLRARMLAGIPVEERHTTLAGIPTALLEGGAGPPLVLLHGPGESAVNWRWVLPRLLRRHRVVAPDLPAHGRSGDGEGRLDAPRVLEWLEAVVRLSPSAPVLVGHVLGGALAARYAVRRSDALRGLVLVDALGLDRFRPSLRFLVAMLGFQARPTERTYGWFMKYCAYDRETLRERMGERWKDFVAYNVQLARSPKSRAAGRLFRKLGLPRIPAEALERISVPTALIWGREDRALPLHIAEKVSERYSWPLHVVDEAADDPFRDRPDAFLRALRSALEGFARAGGPRDGEARAGGRSGGEAPAAAEDGGGAGR